MSPTLKAYEIKRRNDGRFLICSPDGRVLDDAQGYGYKDRPKAEKAAWYKFKGGRAKTDAAKQAAKIFWRSHKEFGKVCVEFLEYNVKAIAFDGIDPGKELSILAKRHGVEGFDPKVLDYLPS